MNFESIFNLFSVSSVGAYEELVPQKPTANLVHRTVLTSVIGQILIQILFLIGLSILLSNMDWYENFAFYLSLFIIGF
jgi:hypothetical protein